MKRFVVLAMVIAAQLAAVARAEAPKPNPGAMLVEIMRMEMKDPQMTLVMWVPYEFMEAAVLQQPGTTAAEAEKQVGFMREYTLMFVQDQLTSPDGSIKFATPEELASRLVLQLPDKSELGPLKSVPPKMAAMAAAMKAGMAQQAGGATHLEVLVFPGKLKDGTPVIDASKKGKLTMLLKEKGDWGANTFVWRTPLDAVSTPTPCDKCKEPVSARFNFCPWCGAPAPKH